MSREVRRVPLDFDFPLGKTWTGYLVPEELRFPPCPDCKNGYTWGREWLHMSVYMLAIAAADLGAQSLGRRMHPYLTDNPLAPGRAGEPYPGTIVCPVIVGRPTPDLGDLFAALSGQPVERATDYHGSCDYWSASRRLIEAAGLDPDVWGICATCGGEAVVPSPELRAAHEAWKPTPPPTGEGWQLWQTVSEGGPVSPVFEDAEGLAQWLVNDAGRLDRCSSIEVARRFVEAGWAPSGFDSSATGYLNGPEFMGRTEGGSDG